MVTETAHMPIQGSNNVGDGSDTDPDLNFVLNPYIARLDVDKMQHILHNLCMHCLSSIEWRRCSFENIECVFSVCLSISLLLIVAVVAYLVSILMFVRLFDGVGEGFFTERENGAVGCWSRPLLGWDDGGLLKLLVYKIKEWGGMYRYLLEARASGRFKRISLEKHRGLVFVVENIGRRRQLYSFVRQS